MWVTVKNRSTNPRGKVWYGKSVLLYEGPNYPNAHAIGVGTWDPMDSIPNFLDASSFVINGNRLAYYDEAPVHQGQTMTLRWRVKVKNNIPDGTYNLVLSLVREFDEWGYRVTSSGANHRYQGLLWQFVVGGDSAYTSYTLSKYGLTFDYPIPQSAAILNVSDNPAYLGEGVVWQATYGVPDTGSVELGVVVYGTGDVNQVIAALGPDLDTATRETINKHGHTWTVFKYHQGYADANVERRFASNGVVVVEAWAWGWSQGAPDATFLDSVRFTTISQSIAGAVVASNITYINNSPRETSFSVFSPSGILLKTIPTPSDLIKGTSNNIKVSGLKIYYMSGSQSLTSIGEIDVATGQSKVLGFTQTVNTNPGNTLFAIVDWAVSYIGENIEIAWMDTSGNIKVANINGTNLRTYSTGIQSPVIINRLEFAGNHVYFNTSTSSDEIRQINLSGGSISTVAVKDPNSPYTVDLFNQYVAYIQPPMRLGVTDLERRQPWSLALPSDMDFVSNLVFSPDGSRVMVTMAQAMGGQEVVALVFYASTGQQISVLRGYYGLGFLDNSRLLARKQRDNTFDLYWVNISGGASGRFGSGSYEGTLAS